MKTKKIIALLIACQTILSLTTACATPSTLEEEIESSEQSESSVELSTDEEETSAEESSIEDKEEPESSQVSEPAEEPSKGSSSKPANGSSNSVSSKPSESVSSSSAVSTPSSKEESSKPVVNQESSKEESKPVAEQTGGNTVANTGGTPSNETSTGTASPEQGTATTTPETGKQETTAEGWIPTQEEINQLQAEFKAHVESIGCRWATGKTPSNAAWCGWYTTNDGLYSDPNWIRKNIKEEISFMNQVDQKTNFYVYAEKIDSVNWRFYVLY